MVHFKLSLKTNCFISNIVHCTDLSYGQNDLTPLIAECIHLHVAFDFRLTKFYRTVALSDNMVVNFIGNTMIITRGQNATHIMFKYKVTHHILLYMPVLLSINVKKCVISM